LGEVPNTVNLRTRFQLPAVPCSLMIVQFQAFLPGFWFLNSSVVLFHPVHNSKANRSQLMVMLLKSIVFKTKVIKWAVSMLLNCGTSKDWMFIIVYTVAHGCEIGKGMFLVRYNDWVCLCKHLVVIEQVNWWK